MGAGLRRSRVFYVAFPHPAVEEPEVWRNELICSRSKSKRKSQEPRSLGPKSQNRLPGAYFLPEQMCAERGTGIRLLFSFVSFRILPFKDDIVQIFMKEPLNCVCSKPVQETQHRGQPPSPLPWPCVTVASVSVVDRTQKAAAFHMPPSLS